MNNTHARFPCLCALAGLSIAWLGMAHAQDTSSTLSGSPVSSMPANWRTVAEWPVAVSDGRLDDTRGGFDLGNGLLASFGIARMVYINGNLVSSIHVDIPDIGRMTQAQANALATATSTVNTIQNGAGNTFDPATFDHATAATVIQNSLDNQDIRSLTTINAAVNSLNTFHALGLQESLQAGVIGSLGH